MSETKVTVRRIDYGATWDVREDGTVVASGIECCEACAMRAAAAAVRRLAMSEGRASE